MINTGTPVVITKDLFGQNKYVGKRGIVVEKYSDGSCMVNIEGIEHLSFEGELMVDLQISDIVKILSTNHEADESTIGQIGEIIRIEQYNIKSFGYEVLFPNGDSWLYEYDELEFISRPSEGGEEKTISEIHSDYMMKGLTLIIPTDKQQPLQIKVKYFYKSLPKLKFICGSKSDWIDLYSAVDLEYTAGEYHLLPLNVAIELPDGYEAHVVPRSSTFKNYGVIQTNSFGVIDNSFSGDNDQWKFPMIAMRNGRINKGDRVCQFRIVRKMEAVELTEVETLDNPDRGGCGSTGKA